MYMYMVNNTLAVEIRSEIHVHAIHVYNRYTTEMKCLLTFVCLFHCLGLTLETGCPICYYPAPLQDRQDPKNFAKE